MEFPATVLYDFLSEGGTELNLRAGETVTVLNTEVGDGWWFGRSTGGEEGVFPAAYVEASPQQTASDEPGGSDSWGMTNAGGGISSRVSGHSVSSWGEEFSSDEDSHIPPPPASAAPNLPPTPSTGHSKPSTATSYPLATRNVDGGSYFSISKLGLGKNGAVESYLSGGMEAAATSSREAITVAEDNGGNFVWSSSGQPYTCVIGVPKKGAKFGGLKAYMAYPVTPSFNNIQVSRRYKHFDWLHERLTAKYGAVIAIPPLPDKQVTGRFEEEVIENRRIELQSFSDRICRHPILSGCIVWKHFISETDDRRWTAGKRKAEADTLVGPALLTTIQCPDDGASHEDIANFGQKIGKMENAVKHMFGVALDQANRQRGGYRKDLQSVANAFHHLAKSLQGEIPCLEQLGDCFQTLGTICEDQVSLDWEPLQHMMHDYRGLTASWSAILGSYTSIADRQKEMEQSAGEKEKLASRSRIHSYRMGIHSEKNFFEEEVRSDLNSAAQNFVWEQINYHRKMADQLEKMYTSCWGGHQGSVAPTPAYPPPTTGGGPSGNLPGLDAWTSDNIYEEMP